MTAHGVIGSQDDFVDAGAPIGLHNHTTADGNTWRRIMPSAVNTLEIVTNGRVQPNVVTNSLAVARVLIGDGFLPAGVPLDKPKFVLTLDYRTATMASREKLLAGLYFKDFGSAVFAGFSTTKTANEAVGDTAINRNTTVIYSVEFGGDFERFPAHSPHTGMKLLAGGSSLMEEDNSPGQDDTMMVYFDEYQVVARWQAFGQGEFPLTYIAYPHNILSFKPYVGLDNLLDSNSLVGIAPVLAMTTDLTGINGARIKFLKWEYYEHDIREARPNWTPYGEIFYARIPLDFIGFGTEPQLVIATADIGPYIIYPPTQYRESVVLCRMLHLDNTKNGGFIDVTLSTDLTFTVPPGGHLAFALPTFDSQIRVIGGGNRAVLTLFSHIVDHQLHIP
ncbi:MAG: hypothetical protein MN733_07645 [Nitrososphaera sp.]|nr:hypothetical protein [Nitrososphaera sp.]